MQFPAFCGWIALAIVVMGRAEDAAPEVAWTAEAAWEARPVADVFELQVELHRRGFSCGSIDGVMGVQTAEALRAWQREAGIRDSGALDRATQEALHLTAPAVGEHVVSPFELGGLQPVPETWLGKSGCAQLGFASAVELVGERYRANPKLLRRLNPDIEWEALLPGARIKVPAVERANVKGFAARIVIRLEERTLEIVSEAGAVIAHFPVSIARMVDKRPVGELHVAVVIPDPNYTFDPAVFPESAEGRELGRRLVIPPGPNNPVGVAWIGLDRTGYGIHGTPEPEKVGRTESHGCFRLANWDAATLVGLVRVGLPVLVNP